MIPTHVCISGSKKCCFSENFAHVLNGWPLLRLPVYPIADVLWDHDNWGGAQGLKTAPLMLRDIWSKIGGVKHS